jgi:formylglycine-generating enzyme required for sulfatase activity
LTGRTLNEELEKKKNEFFERTRKFCNTLIELTRTGEPDTPKQIIYDELDEPEKFEEARQKLNQLRDEVVRSYTDLYKTYIKITEHPEKPFGDSEKSPQKLKPEHKIAIAVAIIGAIATLLAALIGILSRFFPLAPVSTTTNTPTVTATFTLSPTATFTNLPPSQTPEPSLTPTQAFTPTPNPLPTEIVDAKGVTMRLVSAGEFTIGSDKGLDNEKPAHKVYLDDFYMDVYIVTNVRYKACVNASVCTSPTGTGSNERPNYYDNLLFDNYPVIHVNWHQAKTYCEWRAARLPTEAEWEKAARGTDGRIYPWGNEGIEKTFANYANRDTTEVGIYKTGQSPYSIYDLAGNVWEWIDDWYDAYPRNVDSDLEYGQKYRVLRGGSWSSVGYGLRTTVRGWANPDFKSPNIGFRCAHSP